MGDTTPEKASPAELVPITILPEHNKDDIRKKVWDYLSEHRLSSFPFPPHRRIPNFRGAEAAGDQVAGMDLFKQAKSLKVDPDTPLHQVRFRALEAGKLVHVPTPKLRSGLFNRITPPPDCGLTVLKDCATRRGYEEFSVPVGLEDTVCFDLVIVGSVAVSPTGWRIGKGAGFSDMEYAMMASCGSVNPSVPIVALVHDCQVLELPEGIFQEHDVPVDYIVTPTRVIKCSGGNSVKRPSGIIWRLLTAERLARIPVLSRLRYLEWKSGKDVCLAGETEPPTELKDEVLPPSPTEEDGRTVRRVPRRRQFGRRPPKKEDTKTDGVEKSDSVKPVSPARDKPRARSNRNRRPKQSKKLVENGHTSESEKEGVASNKDGSEHDARDKEGEQVPRQRDGGRRRYRGYGRRRAERRDTDEEVHSGDNEDTRDQRNEENRRDYEDHAGDGNGKIDRTGKSRHDDRRQDEGTTTNRRRPIRPAYRRRFTDDCEGSVFVGALPRNVRVSEFKAEVRERDVQPLRVIWRGNMGYAFLNFRTVDDAEHALSALEGLHISDRSLRLEMAKSVAGRRRRQSSEVRSDGGGDDI